MDGITLYASLCECKALIGGKIDKIQQPEQDMLLFTVRNNSVNHKLLLSANPDSGRIQLTGDSFPNPANAPMFCMLLRKRLQGGRIDAIEQASMDRVVSFRISSRDELGDDTTNTLVIEIMGKHSNITLVDHSGTIVDSMKRVGPQMSSVRTLLPGVPFHYMPAQEKSSPFALSLEDLISCYNAAPDTFDRYLASSVSGVSKALSVAIANTACPPRFFYTAMSDLREGILHPCVVQNDAGEPTDVFPFVPDCLNGSHMLFSTLKEAIDYFYAERNITERIRRHGRSLKSSVLVAITKAEKKLALHSEAILAEQRYEQDRLYGDIITANIYQMHKGQQYLKAFDYYAPDMPEIVIPLDALLSPAENAQKYYRRYRKALRAAEFAREQMGQLEEELTWLRSEQESIETCETIDELNEIKRELIAEGYLKEHNARGKPPRRPTSTPMKFVAQDGTVILVGKNNLQNDRITFTSAPDACWAHVKNAPGSHVVVQCHGIPCEETLSDALMLAAFYSSQRNGVSVAVDYTLRKNVKKPSGARAGFVVFTTNKTAYVTPDKSVIKAMKREE